MGSLGANASAKAWWKESSVYQIYPSSFKDSTGNGIGDLRGVLSKADYIKNLGTDIVWLCPIFKSPQVDMGYDIADYYEIDERYGSVADVDELIQELHDRGMKLVMDLVVNHTSDQHEWFNQSRSSVDNPYRDWYIWKPPVIGDNGERQPPNNWAAAFGGSAWEYDEASGEYYLHLFAKEQPDLNWENPHVQDAVHKIVRHWLDKGVDGFRMDVINFISKDQRFPNAEVTNPNSPWQNGSKYYACGPRLHEYLQQIGSILKEYNAFSVGEMPEVNDCDEILKAVGFDRGELAMIFHFEIVDLDHGKEGKFTPGEWQMQEMKSIVAKWQNFMYENKGWNALYLENHDQPRTVTRFGSDLPEYRALSAKMLATFLGFQAGTPFVYQGQELGMANVPRNWGIDKYRDIETINHWHELLQKDSHDTQLQSAALAQYRLKSRDNARTPMQWDASAHAGFSTSEPWISIHDDYKTWNAAAQMNDKNSPYHYWSRVLGLRKAYTEIFVYGSFELICPEHPDVFVYARQGSTGRAVIVLNFRPKKVCWTVPENVAQAAATGTTVLSNYNLDEPRSLEADMVLRPLEALVWLSETA